MNKPINWFEIPAVDLSRAQTFYERILGVQLKQERMGAASMAVFPYDRDAATGGCIVNAPGYNPSRDGIAIYLNAGDSLDAVLNRIAEAGGEISRPKTALPSGMGSFAHIIDTEGNRVGLHAAG